MPTRPKNDINPQTRHHDQQTIARQPQRRIAQKPAPPVSSLKTLPRRAPLLPPLILDLIIFILYQPLMVRRIRVRDLVVEQPGEDEADGCAACRTDVGEDQGERGDRHGCDEAEDDEDGCYQGEAHIAHLLARFRCLIADERVSAGTAICAGSRGGRGG